MRNLILLVLLFINGYSSQILKVTASGLSAKLPDKNASVLYPRDYHKSTVGTSRFNFESNATVDTLYDDSGMTIKTITDATLYRTIKVPKNCIDTNTSDSTIVEIKISGFNVIKDKKIKKQALNLPDSLNLSNKISEAEINRQVLEKIDNTKCIKVYSSQDVNGEVICGKCTDYYAPIYTNHQATDDNETYYLPNNQQLKNSFAFNSKDNKGIDMLNEMFHANSLSEGVNLNNLNTIDANKIPESAVDSKDANISEKVKNLRDAIFLTQLKQNVVRCFVKRELVPRFYCPIPGLEFGAQTGGNPQDDLKKAKAECDSYCKSEPYPCKSTPTGYQDLDEYNEEAEFNFSNTSYDDMKKIVITLPINMKLQTKEITYDLEMKYRDINTTKEFGSDINITKADIRMNIMVEYANQKDSNFTSITGPTSYRIQSDSNKMIVPPMPNADKVRITFYKPTMKHDGLFLDLNIEEIITKIKANNFKVSYTGSDYHFCSYHQIIQEPSTQCSNGTTFEVSNDSETFLVCNADTRKKGPEMMFGSYYTNESCEDNCRNEQECVETYAHYTDDIKDASAYKITVGCVDDPYNTNCSQKICEAKFNNYSDMPIEEIVYDSRKKTRKTVSAGVQIEGQIRPKIILNNEMSASNLMDYDQLFLDETKDEAYKQMVENGTFVYSKKTISKSQPFEYAYREERGINTNIDASNLSPPTQKIFWKLKPASHDIKTGSDFYIYKVAMTEQAFRPASGTFVEDGDRITTEPMRAYKDKVYSYITETGNVPFYIKEFDEVYVDGNSSAGEVNGWVKNTQHQESKFIAYDADRDTYVASSGQTMAAYADIQKFTGAKNYEEYAYIDNKDDFFINIDGGAIQSQTKSTNTGVLSTKNYKVSSRTQGENAAIVNFHFYGIYSKTQLSGEDIISLVNGEDKNKYLIYRATKGTANKKEIYGDGKNRNSKFKMFIKGGASTTTLSVDIKPNIEEESKDVVMFMFLFEGDFQ